ncbi:MAG TPA: hypothetical protein VMC83_32460 [Streptosporangiaceae bacterium]|nr:hypothetical protein [Streptosporangiaceae bacterium]
MSSWNPPPDGSGDWPGDPNPVPPGPQPPQPSYIPPPPPGQGYGQPAGPGYPAPPWHGTPGMGGFAPQSPRRRRLRRLGISGAIAVAVIIVASVITYQHDNHPWKLTAPATAAGMPRDTSPLDTLGLSSAVSGARSAIAKVPGYGSLKSSVSAAYLKGPGPLVWFVGFNGSFNQQIVLKSYPDAKVVSVSAGPHGGAAECAKSTSLTFCQWSTNSTVGDLLIRSSSVLGGPVSTATADSLLIKVRNSVEHSG